MDVRFIDVIIFLLATPLLTGDGFLLVKGPQCYQCAAAFSPDSCEETVSCLSDQECYTQRYLTLASQQVYRLGCLTKGICRIAVQSANDTHCFKCCGDSLCNNDICMKEVCQQGYYGPFCVERCGHCGNGQQCDMVTGQCLNGCAIGYLPPFCNTRNSQITCPKGFYGPFCSDVCGHCSNSDTCERLTGRCTRGCEDGFLPPYCHADCPGPFYGPKCSKTCGYCAGDNMCEPSTGICRDGCQPGFTPPYCIEGKPIPKNCTEVRLTNTTNGIYELTNGRSTVTAWCDMVTDNKEWIVFQRRINASVTFDRNWTEYRHGFGTLSGNFWWGNDNLAAFTANGSYELRIDMEDAEGHRNNAEYRTFHVENEEAKFRLHVGGYSGTIVDSFSANGLMFSTKDRDNDGLLDGSCAVKYSSGWWFNKCFSRSGLLNAKYLTPGIQGAYGIVWDTPFSGLLSFKWVEMKFRPL